MKLARMLYEIQTLELDIIERSKQIKAINARLDDDDRLRKTIKDFEAIKAAHEENNKLARILEFQNEAVFEKIQANETRLYSGSVKNIKEMQDLQLEVESLKRQHAQHDDELLRLLLALDQIKADLDARKLLIDEAQGEYDRLQQALRDEKAALSAEVESLMTKRKSALAKTPPNALQTYNRMRRVKGNRPVAVLRKKTCTSCGIEQDNTIMAALRRGQRLVNCINCDRILLKT